MKCGTVGLGFFPGTRVLLFKFSDPFPNQPKLSFQKRFFPNQPKLSVFKTEILVGQLFDVRLLSAKNDILFLEFLLQVFDLLIFSTWFREGDWQIENLHKRVKRWLILFSWRSGLSQFQRKAFNFGFFIKGEGKLFRSPVEDQVRAKGFAFLVLKACEQFSPTRLQRRAEVFRLHGPQSDYFPASDTRPARINEELFAFQNRLLGFWAQQLKLPRRRLILIAEIELDLVFIAIEYQCCLEAPSLIIAPSPKSFAMRSSARSKFFLRATCARSLEFTSKVSVVAMALFTSLCICRVNRYSLANARDFHNRATT
jgi:hypothetical protein